MAVFNISCNQVWAFWTSPLGPRKRVCMCVSYWACLISSVTRFVHHHWGCLYRYTRTARLRNLIWQPNLPSLSLFLSLSLCLSHRGPMPINYPFTNSTTLWSIATATGWGTCTTSHNSPAIISCPMPALDWLSKWREMETLTWRDAADRKYVVWWILVVLK